MAKRVAKMMAAVVMAQGIAAIRNAVEHHTA